MHRIAALSMVAALLFFNVGVEIGQLMFVLAALALGAVTRWGGATLAAAETGVGLARAAIFDRRHRQLLGCRAGSIVLNGGRKRSAQLGAALFPGD
jgi:hypothetical protein